MPSLSQREPLRASEEERSTISLEEEPGPQGDMQAADVGDWGRETLRKLGQSSSRDNKGPDQ